jgi:predicted amidophosphoribosyltransferase
MLALAIAEAAGKPFAPTALRRIRPTQQQVGLSARERAENVRGAFRVAEGERITVAGRRVLLVDDVYTTGATMKAATRALMRAGAEAVDAVVFARVVRA